MQHRTFMVQLALAVAVACVSQQTMASNDCPSCGASNASAQIPEASGLVVAGSLSAAGASGTVVVESIAAVGDGVVMVVKGASSAASQAATCSIKLGGTALRNTALSVGSAVNVVALSTGTMLVASGQALAFVPNALGQGLLYQSKVR